MRTLLTLVRKELGAYFLSSAAYVTTIFFLVVTGFTFWVLSMILAEGPAEINVLQALFESLFFWITLLVVVPVLTMRLFAEEKKSGTMELLMTAPVSDVSVVLAKFLGALVMFIIMWIPTGLYLVILNSFSPMTVSVDPGAILAGYAGAFLVGGLYISIGLLASSLTQNQILAAISSFAVFVIFFFSGLLEGLVTLPWVSGLLAYISAYSHMADFARGIIDTRPVVFYFTATAWILFATVKVIEARKWK